jgi:hypothetical protein
MLCKIDGKCVRNLLMDHPFSKEVGKEAFYVVQGVSKWGVPSL